MEHRNQPPTLDEAKALIAALDRQDRVRLEVWYAANYDQAGVERPKGYQVRPEERN